MRPRLLLSGPIGCGKSTMIQNALGDDILRAGGYITLRVQEKSKLLGFDLAPAGALRDPEARLSSGRFLDFQQGLTRDPAVFSGLGVDLLRNALQSPFAVADEFGGMELLVDPFRRALMALLSSPVPCIGVFKTPKASRELMERTGLGKDYEDAYSTLYDWLSRDPDTRILSTTGRYDDSARKAVEDWVRYYVRK